MSTTDEDYEALAARLTDPNVSMGEPLLVLTGPAAAAAGRAFLLREYGSDEALRVALGRHANSLDNAIGGDTAAAPSEELTD